MSLEWLNRLNDRAILLLFFLGAIGTSLSSLVVNLATEAKFSEWGEGWLQNFSTELFGAFFGFWLLGIIVDKQRQQEATEKLKQHLIRKMGILDNAIALSAIQELNVYGWLTDGSLRGANLADADLQSSNLAGADLQGVNLSGTDLRGAGLAGASLRGANLTDADLQDAYLAGVDLQEANLENANLQGARLTEANLQGANLVGATFDKETSLPDDKPIVPRIRERAERSFWTPNTSMSRFTDPNHPEFWRSDQLRSPAHQSKSNILDTEDA